MTTPDATAVFEADAQRSSEVDALRARIAELEGHSPTPSQVEVLDADDTPVVAPHSVTIAGSEFRFHAPKPAALLAFGLGVADQRKGQMQLKTMHRFLGFHLLEEDFDLFLERLSDPTDEEFGDEQFGDLINAIVEAAQESPEAKAPKNGPRG